MKVVFFRGLLFEQSFAWQIMRQWHENQNNKKKLKTYYGYERENYQKYCHKIVLQIYFFCNIMEKEMKERI